ncbi:MAG: putative DNA-binding transcriptional regulator, partial [Ilumatobacteraceae bacterium]|nr:putative DNA-binding transcriptional regulator [Ilumatobacteraceae bacterium]
MSYVPVKAIEVWMWSARVGALALDPATGLYAFRYDPAWVSRGIEIAPLRMPLQASTYEFPGLALETYRGLPPLIADSLPDKFGNALVDRWMAEQGVPQGSFTVLDRLAYAADRPIGALEFRPPAQDRSAQTSTAVQLADLVLATRSVLGREPLVVDQAALEQLVAVGTSAGGARPKAVVAYNPATSQIRSAYRDLEPGFEHWLFKLDGAGAQPLDGHAVGLGAGAHYGQVEYAYHLMATAAGVSMSRCELLAEGPRKHFVTRRFDRSPNGEKHHVVSLCGLAHLDFNMVGAHSYDQYFDAIDSLGLGPDALEQAYRRMVFNVAAA